MDFNNYYTQQARQTTPVFKGSPFQRGFGIGNVFKRFFRWVIPIIKSNAMPIVKNVGSFICFLIPHFFSFTTGLHCDINFF